MPERDIEKKLNMMLLYQEVVNYFGGTQESCAKALGVKQGTASGWVNGYHGMHPKHAMKAEKLSGGRFTKEQLCPDTFAP